MCDTREAWYRTISLRYVGVCVILGKTGVGQLFLDLVCDSSSEAWCRKISYISSVCDTREASCRNISLRSVCVCDTREAWCRKIILRSVCVCVILGKPGAGK